MVMWAYLFVGTSVILAFFWARGRQENIRISADILKRLESALGPETVRYLDIGGGVGRRFEYENALGFPVIRGMLTLLPRHAVLYLPFSRMMGRSDLLTITFVSDSFPLGIGHVISTAAWSDGWHFADDLNEMKEFSGDGFKVFAFNPLVTERLIRLATVLAEVPGFRQLSLKHDPHSATFILAPDPGTLDDALTTLVRVLSSPADLR